MNVSVVNLGCKVNRVESDSIAAAYQARGAALTRVEDADVIVVNTCTVTGQAEKKTRKTIRSALRSNPHARVLVTGCAAAIAPEFYEALDSRIMVVDKTSLLETDVTLPELRVGTDYPTRVGVKVQDGCNHSCTYCIVHVARGPAWSRPLTQVRDEVEHLAGAGVNEIVLTGIDLGSYHDGDASASLAVLLKDLLRVCGTARLRISSVEPCSLSSEVIAIMARSDGRICRHLHLPLQAGSTKVLKEMNRPYSAAYYRALCERIYAAIPYASLTTDIIAGFPGETDEEFEETLTLARECAFTKIHSFRYSKRSGTPAAARNDQVPDAVQLQRVHQLLELANELRLQGARKRVGTTERVLVEQQGMGMTESYYKVCLDSAYEPGSLVALPLVAYDDTATFITRDC